MPKKKTGEKELSELGLDLESSDTETGDIPFMTYDPSVVNSYEGTDFFQSKLPQNPEFLYFAASVGKNDYTSACQTVQGMAAAHFSRRKFDSLKMFLRAPTSTFAIYDLNSEGELSVGFAELTLSKLDDIADLLYTVNVARGAKRKPSLNWKTFALLAKNPVLDPIRRTIQESGRQVTLGKFEEVEIPDFHSQFEYEFLESTYAEYLAHEIIGDQLTKEILGEAFDTYDSLGLESKLMINPKIKTLSLNSFELTLVNRQLKKKDPRCGLLRRVVIEGPLTEEGFDDVSSSGCGTISLVDPVKSYGFPWACDFPQFHK